MALGLLLHQSAPGKCARVIFAADENFLSVALGTYQLRFMLP